LSAIIFSANQVSVDLSHADFLVRRTILAHPLADEATDPKLNIKPHLFTKLIMGSSSDEAAVKTPSKRVKRSKLVTPKKKNQDSDDSDTPIKHNDNSAKRIMAWTPEQDNQLLKLIAEHKSPEKKAVPWSKIYTEFSKDYPDMTPDQVKNHWRFHLKDADISLTPEQVNLNTKDDIRDMRL